MNYIHISFLILGVVSGSLVTFLFTDTNKTSELSSEVITVASTDLEQPIYNKAIEKKECTPSKLPPKDSKIASSVLEDINLLEDTLIDYETSYNQFKIQSINTLIKQARSIEVYNLDTIEEIKSLAEKVQLIADEDYYESTHGLINQSIEIVKNRQDFLLEDRISLINSLNSQIKPIHYDSLIAAATNESNEDLQTAIVNLILNTSEFSKNTHVSEINTMKQLTHLPPHIIAKLNQL